jgi:polar amino acid transport system substrate-binding protein
MHGNVYILILVGALTIPPGGTRAERLDDIRVRGELTVGVKTDYPPYGFKDAQGRIVGMEPDMAADLARRLGVSLRMVTVLSSNRAESLRGGEVDLIIATFSITDERRKESGIIDPPYYAAGAAALMHHSARMEETSHLEGRIVCAIEGNIFLNDLKANAPLARSLLFKDVYSAEQALLNGACEALFFNDNLLSYKKRSEPDRFRDYDVVQLLDIDPLLWGIATRRGEEHFAFGRLVSQTVVEWHRSGFLLDLERKWLGSNSRMLEALNVKWASSAPKAAAYTPRTSIGTPTEARAMLERVVFAMKADTAKTLAQITKGEGGFSDRDLYAYCIGPDGKYVAHPDRARIGLVFKDVRDKMGKGFGYEVSTLASEGEIGEVHYASVRPTDGMLRPKVGLYTTVAAHICVVGYYK